MKRLHGPCSEPACEVAFPLSLVDMLSVMLLCIMVGHTAIQVNRQRLPGLRTTEAAALDAGEKRPGFTVEVKADGTVQFQGQSVPLDGLTRRLATESGQERPILVSLETGPDGRGALEIWLQLQADLTQAGLWNRVQVLTRSKSPAGGGNQP